MLGKEEVLSGCGLLSMNRTNSEYALPSKAAEDRRTPRRYRVGDSRAHFRQVLECAGPAALWIAQTGSWFPGSFASNRFVQIQQHPRNGRPGLGLFCLRVAVEPPEFGNDEVLQSPGFVRPRSSGETQPERVLEP